MTENKSVILMKVGIEMTCKEIEITEIKKISPTGEMYSMIKV